MKKLILIASLFLLPNTSWSGFVNNYNDWSELSPANKAIYVQSLYDSYLNELVIARQWEWTAKGINKCLSGFSITDVQLAAYLDDEYERLMNRTDEELEALGIWDFEKARSPDIDPVIVFQLLLQRKCEVFIEKEQENYCCRDGEKAKPGHGYSFKCPKDEIPYTFWCKK